MLAGGALSDFLSGVRAGRPVTAVSLTTHRIQLPSGIAVHQIGDLLRRVHFFPEDAAKITLAFHPKKTHLDPLGVAMLSAWADHWRARGTLIDCENLGGNTAVYAQRVGLVRELGLTPRSIKEHEGAGRFVEVTRVVNQEALTELCANIGGVLKAPHLTAAVQHVLAEIARNALEHAGSAAYVCAQYYEDDKRVTIGIADCGRGVRESLRGSYGFEQHDRAVVAALTRGVSGATRTMYSAPDNAGLGLFIARGISKASRRAFVLASGTAAYKQMPKQTSDVPSHDPTGEEHKLLTDLRGWQGTLVGVNVRGVDANFMSRLGRSLNVGADIAARPTIRFKS